MKVIIFGGGGFIGSSIVNRLLVDGHEIRIFERPNVTPFRRFSLSEQVEWIAGDFTHTHDVSEALTGMDVVVHLVSTTLPKSSNDDPVYDVQSNVVATLQLLASMVARKVRKIVFISSGGTVYGNPKYSPVDEEHSTDPISSYGIGKLAIEKYLYLYSRLHGIESVSLRVSNPYGERQGIENAQGAVGIFLHRAMTGKVIEIWGDGSISRDYIHVNDVAEAFALAIAYSGPIQCFNVSSGTAVSLNELIFMLEDILGYSLKRQYVEGRSFDVQRSVLSNSLAQRELRWTPSISMRDGLEMTVDWLKSMSLTGRKN